MGKTIIQNGSALTAVVRLLFKKDATSVLDAATVRVVSMAFKDNFCEILDVKGGRSAANLERIASLAREIQDDITPAYLVRLIMGQPPRPKDYQALATALGVHPKRFDDDSTAMQKANRDRIYKFAEERMNRPDLANDFYKSVASHTSFRNKVETESIDFNLLYPLWSDFIEEIAEEESLDT